MGWHYLEAPALLMRIFGNILWFFERFFSIKLLTRTLFVPWRRLSEERKKGIDVGDLASSFIVNSIMRVVGFGIRSVVIIMGAVTMFSTAVVLAFALVAWILLPAVVVFLLITGFGLLI